MKQDITHNMRGAHTPARQFPASGLLRDQRGFTLLEVMVVVAIIGVLAGMATVSHLSHLPHKRLMGAADDVMSSFRDARSMSVREGKPFLVCFSTATNSVTLARVNTVAGTNLCADAGAQVLRTDDLATDYPGVSFGTGGATAACPGSALNAVNFGADDRAVFTSHGSSVTTVGGLTVFNSGAVYLTNSDGSHPETVCVRVLGTIGMARLFQWNGTTWI